MLENQGSGRCKRNNRELIDDQFLTFFLLGQFLNKILTMIGPCRSPRGKSSTASLSGPIAFEFAIDLKTMAASSSAGPAPRNGTIGRRWRNPTKMLISRLSDFVFERALKNRTTF